MIDYATLEKISEIFEDTERPDKISVDLDPISRTVTVRYEDLDDEWFKELKECCNNGGGR